MKTLLLAALAATLARPADPARGAASDDHGDRSIVATIDGRAIDAEEFGRFVLAEKARAGAGAEALDELVKERLVEQEARRRGILVTETDIEARMAQIDRSLREQSQGRLGLEDHVQSLKIDRAEFRTLLRKSIACERMMAADFGLEPGKVPAEKQSLWFQDLRAHAGVRTEQLPPGIAAEFGETRITRTEWALKLFKGLSAPDRDHLFDDFVGVQLLLAAAREMKLEVTAADVAQEIDERSRLLRQKLGAEGLATEGVDYLGTLKARGEDPQAVIEGDRFRAEILLKTMTRRIHGSDGFRGFYDAHRKEFDQAFGRRVRLSSVFLKAAQRKSAKTPRTWTEATDELDRLRKKLEGEHAPLAEGFASLAKLRSEDESAARGGDLGFLSQSDLDQRGLPPSLLDEKAGTLEGPITTADGVHLLFVAATKDASPFEEIREEVEKAARRDLLRELRKDKAIDRKI
jgi:parvulin-like peptidyl-prolyl isomerase